MNKTYAAIVLIAGVFLNGMVFAKFAYDVFVPKDSFTLIIQRLDRIENRLDLVIDSLKDRR